MSIESDLYRILAGKLSYEDGFIMDPSLRIKQIGQRTYDECVNFYEDDILEDRQIQIMLMEDGLWSSEKEKRLKELPKAIENNKVFYFQNYGNPPVRKTYKNLVDLHTRELSELAKVRYKYQYLTLEGIASGAMWSEMINYMYRGSGTLRALSYYYENSIKEERIRDIAMCGEWLSYSFVSKTPLRKSPLKMTDHQKKLLSWTNIYRNVRSNPDYPGEQVAADHEAFDGWLIVLNRKDKMDKGKTVNFKNMKENTRNVFIGQSDQNEADEIDSLNNQGSKRIEII